MKSIYKIVLAGGVFLTLASCGVADPYYGNNRYPNGTYGNSRVYRTADGNVYRQGDVYRDRNGVVYRDGRVIDRTNVYGRPGIISRPGNYGGNYRKLPPGQAKKVYGGRATDYAYGQQKKRYGNQNHQGNQGNKKYSKYYKKNNKKKYKNNKRWDD